MGLGTNSKGLWRGKVQGSAGLQKKFCIWKGYQNFWKKSMRSLVVGSKVCRGSVCGAKIFRSTYR